MLLTEAPTTEPSLYRVSADEFERMAHAGAFHPEARVELVNGVLVQMSPIRPPHAFVVRALDHRLQRQLGDRAVVSVQSSLRCGDESEPEPDIAIARGPHDLYRWRHPRTEDALLVIEVADSSLRFDQKVKVPLYGTLGVPEAWVVDIPGHRVHVYTDPKEGGYGSHTVLTTKDTLVPTAFPEVEIPVSELRLDR